MKNYLENVALKSNFLSDFSWSWLIGGFFFGIIGLIAFRYGKKNSKSKEMIVGIILMVYPYFVRNIIAFFLIGFLLIALLFIFRKY